MGRISFQLLILVIFCSCNNEIQMNSQKSASSATPLIWNYDAPRVRPGEVIPFSFSNGGSSFTTDANGIGVFNSSTLEYTPSTNLAPQSHTIYASSPGFSGSNSVLISAFTEGNKIGFPLTFGDQTFPVGLVQTTDGKMFTAAIVSDSPGWERWVAFRSTDNGESFSMVDHFVTVERGETHPLDLMADGNNVYVCGYAWGLGIAGVEWIIRRSTDGGVTWEIADRINDSSSTIICHSMVRGPTGNLYAAGYNDSIGGILRESVDGGVTWNTIFTMAPTTLRFVSINFSPSGDLWVKDSSSNFYRGTFAGTWSFNLQGTAAGTSSGPYELLTNFAFISPTEILALATSGGKLLIQKSTDSGATWTTTHTTTQNARGHDILQLTSGEWIVPTQSYAGSPKYMTILRSTDDGDTWTEVYNNNTHQRTGFITLEAQDLHARILGYDWAGGNEVTNVKSVDAGLTWTDSTKVRYSEKLYHWLSDFTKDTTGNLWASAYVGMIDNTFNDAWAVVKSTDGGTTWTESDVFTDPGRNLQANCLTASPTGAVFAAEDSSPTSIVRRTIDAGASWTTVDSDSYRCSRMTSDSGGNVYYVHSSFTTIRRGLTNGTVWSNGTASFPIAGGSTGYTPRDLKVLSDDSLWLSLTETNGGTNHVLYRSTDGGNSFTEVFREVGSISYQRIREKSPGDIYAIQSGGLYHSTNGGITWLQVYDNSLGTIMDYGFDVDGRVYVMTNTELILAQNQYTGSFFMTYNFDTAPYNTYEYYYLERLVDCGAPSGICAIGSYDKSFEGAVKRFFPLTAPF